VMPVSSWMRSSLAALTRSCLESLSGPRRGLFRREWVMMMLDDHLAQRADWGQQLWTLMVLEIWFQLFVDRSLDPHTKLEHVGAVRAAA
jgi:asparagine synthase (glutamine-hydrolysing)